MYIYIYIYIYIIIICSRRGDDEGGGGEMGGGRRGVCGVSGFGDGGCLGWRGWGEERGVWGLLGEEGPFVCRIFQKAVPLLKNQKFENHKFADHTKYESIPRCARGWPLREMYKLGSDVTGPHRRVSRSG